MLLYITAEDVLGDGRRERKGPKPPLPPPLTLNTLYDRGMRHHDRPAAMLWPRDGGFEAVPDWKLDRLVIRVALFARERLGLRPGGCVAVAGELSWPWPLVDFAAPGLGARSLGIEPGVADDVLAEALGQHAPTAVFATDAVTASRLTRLRGAGLFGGALVVPDGCGDGDGVLPIGRVLELAATLDTAERAQGFRASAREVAADAAAWAHVSPGGSVRLGQREALAAATSGPEARPGDVAYLESPHASLAARLLIAAFLGDGLTTTALGHACRASQDVAEVRPHKMLASGSWLEAACEGTGPRWPAGLDRGAARRRLRARLGDRLRWVVTAAKPGPAAARALDAAGVEIVRAGDDGSAGGTAGEDGS